MVTKKDVILQREQAQEDILCILDSLPIDQTVIDNVCQVIVDRFNALITESED